MAGSEQGTKAARHQSEQGFVITRLLDAPRDLVFSAWTDAEHLKHWWGPKGCRIGTCKLDLRPGGSLLYSMQMPDGAEMWGKFVYREILAPERLVFVNSFSDPDGNLTRAPFAPTWPLEVLNTLTLSEQFGKTALTLLANPVSATEQERELFDSFFDSLHQGFSGTFDQLAGYLRKI
jgi:uncharacterized protein YndB with AHSA1/START domain